MHISLPSGWLGKCETALRELSRRHFKSPFHLFEGGRGGGEDCFATNIAARGDGKNMKLKGSCLIPYWSYSELLRRQLTLEIRAVMFSKGDGDLRLRSVSGGKG
jgi:hypothetical protein